MQDTPKLDMEAFLSSHDEEELMELRAVIDRIIEHKRSTKELSVPLGIFSGALSSGEALVKYLHEDRHLSFADIARQISKSTNVVWLNYQRAAKKQKSALKPKDTTPVPVYIFKSELSYLESLAVYLRDTLHYSNKKTAKVLGKSQQTVSIAYNRAQEKLGGAS